MATPKIIPRANGGGGLGMPGKGWGSIYVTDVTTSSANQGGIVELASDDGAPMGDSHRLGVIYFKGAEDSSNTLTTGARIEALTDAAWTNVENGCALYFYTTDGNASETNVLKLDSNKKATFAGDVLVNGDEVALYDATNDGNPTINLGSSATNRFEIKSKYNSGAQTVDEVYFSTYTTSSAANDGRYIWEVDEVELARMLDSGLVIYGNCNLSDQGASFSATNTTASSATEGGKLRLNANDGAAMADNHRLGIITFEGAEDGAANLTVGAQIEAFCDAAWSASENGARMVFSTTDGNASTSTVLTLDSNKLATFAGAMQVDGAGGMKSTAGAVTGINYRTIYIDAGGMVPAATNGAVAGTEETHATNFTTLDKLIFVTGTEQYADFKMVMPEQYDNGTIKAKFYWKPADAEASVSVVWGIKAYAATDSDLLTGASGLWGTGVTIEDASLNTADDLHISSATAAMTIAGTPAEGKLVFFRVYRAVANVLDDYADDAELLGVNIQYTESATASAAW